MKEHSFYLISLGCSKNTVDSQSIGQLLLNHGYTQVDKPGRAEILVVNTCGFIQPARDEAIEVLNELSDKKRRGQLLFAAGCMAERHHQVIAESVKGIDGIIGTRRWMDLVDFIQEVRQRKSPAPLYHLPSTPSVGSDDQGLPRFAIQGGSAYLKIADGCHRPCAFCSIPLIKGNLISRPMETILAEAERLTQAGVKEIILIAQDSTSYGHDLGLADGLPTLLEELVKRVPDLPWIRILYTFPGSVSDHLIDVMAHNPQILHYFDIPLQHSHPQILQKMIRPTRKEWAYHTIEKMRKAMPDLAIRTTFIVGYPGETEEEFTDLMNFVSDIRFDRVGVFPFYFEPGTSSETLGDPVPFEVKQERVERLMLHQEDISHARNREQIGKTLDILIEGEDRDVVIGRSYRDAPEIDGLVFAEGKASTGDIIPVKVTGALPHDLIGQICSHTKG